MRAACWAIQATEYGAIFGADAIDLVYVIHRFCEFNVERAPTSHMLGSALLGILCAASPVPVYKGRLFKAHICFLTSRSCPNILKWHVSLQRKTEPDNLSSNERLVHEDQCCFSPRLFCRLMIDIGDKPDHGMIKLTIQSNQEATDTVVTRNLRM